MAATDASVKQLQLQISASTELLIRNLKQADATVADFRRQTDRNLDQIDGRFRKLGEDIGTRLRGALGGVTALLGGASLISLAKDGLEYASSLGEVAQQLGVSTTQLQAFRYAASQVGVSQEEMDRGLSKLTLTIGQAADGSKKQASAFNDLGINVRTAAGAIRSAGDIIPELADALAKVKDPAERARIEVELFGKTGQRLDTLLSGGSKALNELTAAAEKMGLVLSPELIQRADDAADRLGAIKTVLEAQIAGVVAENADAILVMANAFAALAVNAANAVVATRNFFAIRAVNGGDTAAAVSLAQTSTGRQALLNDIDEKIKKNQSDRARARGDRQSYLFGAIEVTRNAKPEDLAKLDRDFQDLVRQRNAVLEIERKTAALNSNPRSANVGAPGLNRITSSGGGTGRSPKLSKPKQTFDEYVASLTPEGLTTDIGHYSPKLTADVTDALAAVNEVRAKAEAASLEFFRAGEERARSIADTLYDGLSGRMGSFWDTFKDFGLRAVSQVASRLLTNNGGAGGGISGIIKSSLGSIIGGAFAAGGDPPLNKISLVGERGPELFVPKVNGTIIPNHALGHGRMQVEATVSVRPSPLFETSVEQTTLRTVGAAAEPIMAGAQVRTMKAMGRRSLPGGYGG